MCYDSITRLVDIWPVPTARFTLTDDWDDIQGQVKLNNQSDGATSYFWDFADGGTSTVENPVYQYTLDSDPVYNLMLIAYNDYGCPDTLIYPYSIIFTGLYVPNAFSPSLSDPALNTFKPVAINLTSYKLDILSSTGELVFSSTLIENGKPAEGWDGKYQGQDLPTGVYVWRINAQFLDGTYWRGSDNGDGNTRQYGTVTLIR
jgi:PKD repeat protein